jgi:hypothetical protein
MVEVLIVLVIVGLVLAMVIPAVQYIGGGAGVWGPTRTQEVLVQRLYVDSGGGKNGSSHYMVGTDKGVFEVDNGVLLWQWNSDELYAQMKEGKRYRIRTEGNKVVGFFLQEYPYITAVEPLP